MTKLLTLVLAMPYFDGLQWHRDVGQPFDTSKLDAKVVEKLQTKGFLMTAAAYKARTNPEAAEVQATADATAEQLATAQERVTELEDQLQMANSSVTTMTAERDQAQQQVSTLTAERDEAERKVTSLGEQVGSLTTQLGEKVRESQELTAQVATAQAERDAAKKALAEGKVIPTDAHDRLVKVPGIGEALAKKALDALTAE